MRGSTTSEHGWETARPSILPTRAKVAALTIGVVAAVGIFSASQKSSDTADSQIPSPTSSVSPSGD